MRLPVKVNVAVGILCLLAIGLAAWGLASSNHPKHQQTAQPAKLGHFPAHDSTQTAFILQGHIGPPVMKIPKGTTVLWVNNGPGTCQLANIDASQAGPHSPELPPGGRYSYKFTQPGTYTYTCTEQPAVKASVTVTN